jgi:two-component system phosphate regulon response regulator PhoB
LEECRVTSFDREITLSPKEFKLLELFMKNPKRVWSRDLILEKIWEIDFIGDTKTEYIIDSVTLTKKFIL